MQSLTGESRIEKVERRVVKDAFSPHRHDTYTIALTVSGVQAFNYLRELRHSLAGQAMILHPDELHDGHSCDEAGFAYRAAYVPPADIQMVVDCDPLPFLSGGISADPALVGAVGRLLDSCEPGSARLAYEDALFDLVKAMAPAAPCAGKSARTNREAVMRVRQFLDTVPAPGTGLAEMEAIAGYDRWQLSRDFRRILGTSPYRYLQCRRIDRAKQLLREGASLAAAAHDAGFADQSHFGREFRKTFGMSPLAWHRAERMRTIVL